jgi:hypothetical protein
VNPRFFVPALVAVFTVVLSACGGGSGASSSQPNVNPPPTSSSATSSASSVSSASVPSTSSSSSSSSSSSIAATKAGYTLVFQDEFDTLDVSANGPNTKWTAHTPWHGDFGDALFADPTPGFPFTVTDGILRIEARKDSSGKWKSGLLASVDANNNGFKLQYGYFEVRAKLPPGEGMWPAFWLDSMIPSTSSDPSLEIDVFEYYGQFPEKFHSTVTQWPKDRTLQNIWQATVTPVTAGSLTNDFHTFGVDVQPDWITIYLDGVQTWRTPTPATHKHGLMILVNLAMGGGWSIANAPSPSYMYVDYIRAYEKL